MKHIIHVNQAVIAHNRKTGESKPPLIVRTYKGSTPADDAEIWYKGVLVGRFIHRPHSPLPCGARVWFETTNADVVCS